MTNTKAQVGDLIRITQKIELSNDPYAVGDILEVTGRRNESDIYADYKGAKVVVAECEYVIHRKLGEEDSVDLAQVDGYTLKGGKIVKVAEIPPQDAVNQPSHYTQGKFETIEVIEHLTSKYDDGFTAHCVGTAFKYMDRAPYKHDTPTECLRKAAKYLEFAIARLDA